MASKSPYYSLFFLLLLLHTLPTFQQQNYEQNCLLRSYPVSDPRRGGLPLKISQKSHEIVPKNPPRYLGWQNSPGVIVDVDKIAKAIWDSGYKIFSRILETNLHRIVPYSGFYNDNTNTTITLYNNNSAITIFVPPDGRLHFAPWIAQELQVVTSKVDKEAFDLGSLSKGSELITSHWFSDTRVTKLVVTEVPDSGFPSIDCVEITKWDIYNDGHVIVHGVEDFFSVRVLARFGLYYY